MVSLRRSLEASVHDNSDIVSTTIAANINLNDLNVG